MNVVLPGRKRPVGPRLRLIRLWSALCLSLMLVLSPLGARAAISLVAHAKAGGDGNVSTTAGANTTGANLIVLGIPWYIGGADPVITDSKGNAWTSLTRHDASSISSFRLFYCASPVVGTGHTFTATAAGSAPLVCMLAFSGCDTVPFDKQNGAGTSGGADVLQTGSVTPAVANSVVITGVTWDTTGQTAAIDGGFTISDQADLLSGSNMGGAAAYLIQTTATAANPTWTFAAGGGHLTTGIAVFKAAAAGGSAIKQRRGNGNGRAGSRSSG